MKTKLCIIIAMLFLFAGTAIAHDEKDTWVCFVTHPVCDMPEKELEKCGYTDILRGLFLDIKELTERVKALEDKLNKESNEVINND